MFVYVGISDRHPDQGCDWPLPPVRHHPAGLPAANPLQPELCGVSHLTDAVYTHEPYLLPPTPSRPTPELSVSVSVSVSGEPFLSELGLLDLPKMIIITNYKYGCPWQFFRFRQNIILILQLPH